MKSLFFYTVRMFFQKRSTLRFVNKHPLHHLNLITAEYLNQNGVKLLALDFDGVLAHHGALEPLEKEKNWLQSLNSDFSLEQVCIYSNNLFPQRINRMRELFPTIEIIYYSKKKPFPEDLIKTIKKRKLDPHEVLVIDDRLTSGVLAACISGSQTKLLKPAAVNYHFFTIKEFYYSMIRFFENLLVR